MLYTEPVKTMPWMQVGPWWLGTDWMIENLTPGTRYSVRVIVSKAVGVSKPSAVMTFTTLPVAPGTPSELTVKSVTSTSAAITWTAPTAGGAKISDYLAEVSTDNGQTWKTVVKTASSSTTLTLKNLKTKTSYLFRISAKNTVGYSNPSGYLEVTTL
jgi:MinD superfamily P-loop ATPase